MYNKEVEIIQNFRNLVNSMAKKQNQGKKFVYGGWGKSVMILNRTQWESDG